MKRRRNPLKTILPGLGAGVALYLAARFLRPVRDETDISDETLKDRVISILARATSHPAAISVGVAAGKVTVSGPVLVREAEKVLARVARVPGVKLVEDRLERHPAAGNIPELQ